jgi:hypothetical protein
MKVDVVTNDEGPLERSSTQMNGGQQNDKAESTAKTQSLEPHNRLQDIEETLRVKFGKFS